MIEKSIEEISLFNVRLMGQIECLNFDNFDYTVVLLEFSKSNSTELHNSTFGVSTRVTV